MEAKVEDGPPRVEEDLCEYCFDVMYARWDSKRYPSLPDGYDPALKTALFVTFNEYYDPPKEQNAAAPWTKKPDFPSTGSSEASTTEAREERLRGCIGCLDAGKLTLQPGLQNYCCSAAFKDGRFAPIRREEVPNLTCTVSLLHSFETAEGGSFDWEVGRHGVIVDFWDKSGREYSATYLPEIAEECGFDQRKAVFELCRKAGYRGVVDETITGQGNMKVTRYQSTRVKMSGSRYLSRRG